SFDDKDQEYNDKFFELSMALRFSQSFSEKASISLKTDCDIIISDLIAIECKYLHTKNQIVEHVEYAMKQIDVRIEEQLAKFGMVALDFSNILDQEEIERFAYYLFDDFSMGYNRLEEDVDDVLKSVLSDGNFASMMSNYITHKVEVEFYDKIFKSDLLDKMNVNTKAILMQVTTSVSFFNDNQIIPVPMRAMTRLINPKLHEDEQKKIHSLINSLATGI
ncbi:hypothetical protein CO493_RS26780, partial [Vibrio parahaemolyticus]|nr:hypothetical protein [Vibrio parahaemolyticus]